MKARIGANHRGTKGTHHITVQANIGPKLFAEWQEARRAAGAQVMEGVGPWTLGFLLERALSEDIETFRLVKERSSPQRHGGTE